MAKKKKVRVSKFKPTNKHKCPECGKSMVRKAFNQPYMCYTLGCSRYGMPGE